MSLIYSIHFPILVPVSTLISVANKMYCRVGMQASNHFFVYASCHSTLFLKKSTYRCFTLSFYSRDASASPAPAYFFISLSAE